MHASLTSVLLFLMAFMVGGIFFDSLRRKAPAKGMFWTAILLVFLLSQFDAGLSPLFHSVLLLVRCAICVAAVMLLPKQCKAAASSSL